MVCIPSRIGRRIVAMMRTSAMRTPTGRPMINAISTAVMMMERLSSAMAQRPNIPMRKGSAAKTMDATNFFDEYHESKPTARMYPHQGIKTSISLTVRRKERIPAEIESKTGA